MITITKVLETKTIKTQYGDKPKQVVVLSNGVTADFWGSGLIEGQEIDAIVVPAKDDKYNPTLKINKPGFTKKTSPDFAKIMEKKEASITRSQDAKFDSIKRAGSITNATNLLIAMLESKIVATGAGLLNGSDVHQMLENEIAYFEGLYDKEQPPF